MNETEWISWVVFCGGQIGVYVCLWLNFHLRFPSNVDDDGLTSPPKK